MDYSLLQKQHLIKLQVINTGMKTSSN